MSRGPEWEEPPSPTSGLLHELREELAALARHPGEWARLRAYSAPGPAYRARRRLTDNLESHEFVVRRERYVGRRGDGHWLLYGRAT